VEDGPDRWAPPIGETERGPCVSCCGKEGGARGLLGLRCALGPKPGTGPRREERGRRESRPGGEGEKWAEPETGRGRGNLFPFYLSSFYSNLLTRIFKTIIT